MSSNFGYELDEEHYWAVLKIDDLVLFQGPPEEVRLRFEAVLTHFQIGCDEVNATLSQVQAEAAAMRRALEEDGLYPERWPMQEADAWWDKRTAALSGDAGRALLQERDALAKRVAELEAVAADKNQLVIGSEVISEPGAGIRITALKLSPAAQEALTVRSKGDTK